MYLNGKSRPHSPGSESPILYHIAEQQGELRTEVRHIHHEVRDIKERVKQLERRPKASLQEYLPWMYGALVLVASIAGRIKLETALELLSRQ